jgi:hypothetical protein
MTLTVNETEELPELALLLPRQESLPLLPVSETDTFLSRYTTEIDDQSKQDQSGQSKDLDQTEPELDLSKGLDTWWVHSFISSSLYQCNCDMMGNVPNVLMAITKTIRIVTHAAELMVAFQNLVACM